MVQALIERAHQLILTKRYKDAEAELKNALSQEPNNADALALLAICKTEARQINEAHTLIRQAIHREPENPYFLYLQANFYLHDENLKEAEKFIRNAIAFDPQNAEYFGLLAIIKINQKDWKQALEYANQGLSIDSDNITCLNQRTTALFKLDKKEEAYSTIKEALDQDPENEMTHANIGWGLLEKGDHKKALEHFREALKINPNFDYAKAGLVEGLKSRYWFYRVFLKYAFWIGNLKGKAQWAVILGLYFGIRILRGIADSNENLAMFLTPIIVLYTIFAISTWIIGPLSNLFLRLNVYGRYALTKSEIISSNFVGIALSIGLLGALGLLFQNDFVFLMIAIFGVSMMIPLSSMLNPSKKQSQYVLITYTALLAAVGIGAIVLNYFKGEDSVLGGVYIFGVVIYQWVANAMIIR